MRETDWMADAECQDHDPEIWFPSTKVVGDDRLAKEICWRCPVSDECLEYALEHDLRHGVFGGLNELERHNLKRRQTRATSRAYNNVARGDQ